MLLDAAFKAFAKRLLRYTGDPERLFREIAKQEPILAKLLRDSPPDSTRSICAPTIEPSNSASPKIRRRILVTEDGFPKLRVFC